MKSAQTLTNIVVSGGIPVPLSSNFLRLSLTFNTQYSSFRFESFIITFWGALLVDLIWWQSSTFEGLTGALHFENKSKRVTSRALSAISSNGNVSICHVTKRDHNHEDADAFLERFIEDVKKMAIIFLLTLWESIHFYQSIILQYCLMQKLRKVLQI